MQNRFRKAGKTSVGVSKYPVNELEMVLLLQEGTVLGKTDASNAVKAMLKT